MRQTGFSNPKTCPEHEAIRNFASQSRDTRWQSQRPVLKHTRCQKWQTTHEENRSIYGRLSFPGYYLNCPCLDTEWLLSTLFDASLLSTSKPPETAALFLGVTDAVIAPETITSD
jgi:hypothetical protein